MHKNIVVLCGTMKEYHNFIRANFKHGQKQGIRYVFPQNEDQLRGLRLKGMEIIGSFWDREDAKELHSYVVDRITQDSNIDKKEEKVDTTN